MPKGPRTFLAFSQTNKQKQNSKQTKVAMFLGDLFLPYSSGILANIAELISVPHSSPQHLYNEVEKGRRAGSWLAMSVSHPAHKGVNGK